MRRLLSRAAPTAALLALAAACWVGSLRLADAANAARASWPRTEETAVLPSPAAAPYVSLGYRELFADMLWCRTLVYYGSSLVGETDLRDLERYLDLVLALDPKFKRVYRWAAFSVTYKGAGTKIKASTATQDEYRTSVRYLERGLKEFPDEYELFWLAGSRYWLDLRSKDPAEQARFRERGAELIEQAMSKKDAPADLATVAATFRTKLGQKERALHDLKEMILTVDDEEARQKLLARAGALGDAGIVEELTEAREAFDRMRIEHGRNVPPDLFVLLGPKPPARIDFRDLATDRDLFGTE